MTTQPVAVSPRVERRYELTRLQAEVWTSQRLYPDTPVANMATAHRISGPIEPTRFVEAFDTVVRASDALRTIIGESSARPAESIAHVLASPPRRTVVRDIDAADVAAWCAERIAHPIDATSCCYDSVLLRHADDDWTWWLDLHHLVTDATSQSLVHRQTSLAYEGAELATSSFADVAIDQPTSSAGVVAGESPAPLRPFGVRRPVTTASTRRAMSVDDIEPAELAAVASATYPSISPDLSLAAVLAAGLACTMQRLDGRSEFTIGLPIGNRSDRRRRDLVGPLMELQPVRVVIEPDDTFSTLVERTLASVIDMLRAYAS